MEQLSVSAMCRILQVSRSGFYDWSDRAASQKDKDDAALKVMIQFHFDQQRGRAGARTIKNLLKNIDGVTVSRRRIGRLMKSLNLQCKTKKRFKATTNSKHKFPVASNVLDRQFSVAKPDSVYAGDITYVWTDEGWLYLSIWLDLFSRAVVGWSMGDRLKASLATDALRMAIERRDTAPGLMIHSDQGVQYASSEFQDLLDENKFVCSMSRKGNCWDNSVAESFFGSLKKELIHHCRFRTREEASLAIFDYIERFYNRQRVHSYNDYVSPLDFEAEYRKAA